jgi:hypothetical protein
MRSRRHARRRALARTGSDHVRSQFGHTRYTIVAPTSTGVPRWPHTGHGEIRSAIVGCRPHTAFRRSSSEPLVTMRHVTSNTRDVPKPLKIQCRRPRLSAQLTVKFAQFMVALAPKRRPSARGRFAAPMRQRPSAERGLGGARHEPSS